MSEVSESIVISAPVEKVFGVVTTPENWTKYVTSLTEVSNMSENIPQKGSTFVWEYKMMGVKFRGKGTVTENDQNKAFCLSMEGKFPIKETYDFSQEGNGTTRLAVKIQYDIPGELLGMIADKLLLEKLNVSESKNVLEKIRMLCEA